MEEINVQEVIKKHREEPRFLVSMMQDIQDKCNYLPRDVLEELCKNFI